MPASRLPAPAFDYASLKKGDRAFLQQKTTEIRDRMGRAAQNIVEIGERLIAVKHRLGHGKFGAWLTAEFDWSERTADNMMNVSRRFKSANFADLSIAPSALYLLAAPSTPEPVREAFIDSAKNGHPVTHAAVRAAVAPPGRSSNGPSNGHAGGNGSGGGHAEADEGDDEAAGNGRGAVRFVRSADDAHDPDEDDPAVKWFRAINVIESVLGWLPDKTALAALPAAQRQALRERFRAVARKLEQAV